MLISACLLEETLILCKARNESVLLVEGVIAA